MHNDLKSKIETNTHLIEKLNQKVSMIIKIIVSNNNQNPHLFNQNILKSKNESTNIDN